MNAQQQKQVQLNFNFIKDALLVLSTILGKDGLIDKIKDLLDGDSDASDTSRQKLIDGLKYLETQDEETKKLIVAKWLEQLTGESEITTKALCCPSPKPITKPTPYGSWNCNENRCEWYWVPELG